MYELTIRADCREEDLSGVKEALSMLLEQWGDVRLTGVREVLPEQLALGGMGR